MLKVHIYCYKCSTTVPQLSNLRFTAFRDKLSRSSDPQVALTLLKVCLGPKSSTTYFVYCGIHMLRALRRGFEAGIFLEEILGCRRVVAVRPSCEVGQPGNVLSQPGSRCGFPFFQPL